MIYLDHAATSFPKPKAVLDAVSRWFCEQGVSADRGDSQSCGDVSHQVAKVRREIGNLCGVPAQHIAFTSGATESLNLCLRGHLRQGDRVLTTAIEHSSLARPLRLLQTERGIEIEILRPDAQGRIDPELLNDALRQRQYQLLAFSHASNVLGTVQDASRLCKIATEHGASSLLDASQTAGLLPLDVGADMVVASAHKSLMSPPGLGFLATKPGVELTPTRAGGTGSSHALDQQPEDWPTRMEAGTPNTPAIMGLGAALDWLATNGSPLEHGLQLLDSLREALARKPDRVKLLGPAHGPRVPILSFTSCDMDPAEAGLALAEQGIHVRTGFHCAPWIHEVLGTGVGGTIRVSPGPFIQKAEILEVASALLW